MGDCFKLSKDKRQRSSSSLVGLEESRSERKLECRASIPEVDEQFTIAEARCDELQSKIDLVKAIKRKRRLKKRSMTHMTDSQSCIKDDTPFITVQTQSKKSLLVTEILQDVSRIRRYEVAAKPTARKSLEPEQYIIQKVSRGTEFTDQGSLHTTHASKSKPVNVDLKPILTRNRRNARADGDSVRAACSSGTGPTAGVNSGHYAEDEVVANENYQFDDRHQHNGVTSPGVKLQKQAAARRRRSQRDRLQIAENLRWVDVREDGSGKEKEIRAPSPVTYRANKQQSKQRTNAVVEDRPVVELFNNRRESLNCDMPQVIHAPTSNIERTRKARESRLAAELETEIQDNVHCAENLEEQKELQRPLRRARLRSRRYERPTVASQMKQAGVRYYCGTTNRANIPFIVSKSTAPSHNIGVNIQQVLNGMKIQQPVSGIPLTMAHHMGLRHVPAATTKSVSLEPLLGNREINVIKLGRQLLRLPSYKFMSYNRILKLYKEGEGIVPRFLRSISRPHYFYTSMYNLSSNTDEYDGATSKGRGGSDSAKQSLTVYASLYKEFERVEKCIEEGNSGSELLRRRDELSRELAARESHIRRVVQEYRGAADDDHKPLRVSASTGGEGGFMQTNSTYKLNVGDRQ